VPTSRALRNGFLFLISLVSSGCATPRDPLPAPAQGSGPPAVHSIALSSLSNAAQQAHFAFRPDEGGWIGGDRTYRVRADLTGTSLQVQNGRSLLFGRTSIARDGIELAAPPHAIEPQSNGGIAIDRGVARETLENTDTGVEQSWRFDTAPPGSGGLVVRIPVQGPGSASRSDRGLRFGDSMSSAAALYSDATWVDAQGNRTAVPVSWRHGAIEIDVPPAVVSSSTYPAVLDPTVGPEFVIGAGAAPGAAPTGTDPPPPLTVAYANGIYLVAWGTVGTRVRSSDGVVLDPAGFDLPATSVPSIVGSGDQFFVVWADGNTIKGVKIRAVDHAILDPGVVTLSQPLSDAVQIAVTASSTEYLVGWMDVTNVYGAYFERIRPADLQVLDANPILLPGTPINQIAVASDGTDFVAFYGAGGYVANGLPYGITETRISSDGSLIDPDGIAYYSPSSEAQATSGPQATYSPSGYAATYVWDESMVTHIVPACSFEGTKQAFLSPAITFDGFETLVTLQDFRGSNVAGTWVGNGASATNWAYSVDTTCSAVVQLPGTSAPVLASNGAGQTLAAFQDTPNVAGVFLTTCDAGFCGTVATSDDGGVVIWPDAGDGGAVGPGDAQAPTDASDDRTIGSGSGDASNDGSPADASSALDSGAGPGDASAAETDAGEAEADAGQVSSGPDASADAGMTSGGGGSVQGGSGCQLTSSHGAPERGGEMLVGLVALGFMRRRSRARQ
jgi:hypothetical protein